MKESYITKIIIVLVAFLQFFALPSYSYAHVLKTDGSIGAVLHINPEDDPIAGEESSFFFELKDTENRLTAENCVCFVTILQSGKEIHREQLFQGTENPTLRDASFTYIFLQKDIYTVTISGVPAVPNAFSAFQLTYSVRVSRDSARIEHEPSESVITPQHIVHGLLVLCGFIVAIYIVRNDKRKEGHD